MKLFLEKPMVLRLQGVSSEELPILKKILTYQDEAISYLLSRTKKNLDFLLKNPNSPQNNGKWKYAHKVEWAQKKILALKAQEHVCLLMEDSTGYWTYPGLAPRLAAHFGTDLPKVSYPLPEYDLIPWSRTPKYKNRYYQEEAVAKLLESSSYGPGAISISTGGGKTSIARSLVKAVGLKTLINTPSVSIAEQIYEDLLYHFGSKYVGFYGGGKKQANKLFVIAIDDSLVRVEPNSKDWAEFQKVQMVIFDEAHQIPSATQHHICSKLVVAAPYRFFMSATLYRNDGKDLLLEGLSGPSIYTKTLKELVDEGFLARPRFQMVELQPEIYYEPSDPNAATRQKLFYSEAVNKKAAELAREFVLAKKPTLIRIDEIEQFSYLYKHLKDLRVGFAHGSLTKDNRDTVPDQFRESDPNALVAEFNAGNLDVLIGTSCIGIGTDIQVAEAGIYLVGGMSSIEISQSVGRVTRGGVNSTVINPWTGVKKTEAVWVDFDVNTKTLTRHAAARRNVYEELYGPVTTIG